MRRKILISTISTSLLAAVLFTPIAPKQIVPTGQCAKTPAECQTVIQVCVDISSMTYQLCMAIPGNDPTACDSQRLTSYDQCVRNNGCDPDNPPPIKLPPVN